MTKKLNDAFFRALFHSPVAGVAVADLQSAAIIEINEEFLRILGCPREDVVGVPHAWENFTPAEYRHLDYRGLEQVSAEGQSDPFEKEYQRQDGRRIPVRVSSVVVSEYPDRLIVFAVDITEERAGREREERAQQRLEIAISAANQGVWDLDLVSGAIEYSERARAIYGLSPTDRVSFEVIRDLTHRDDLPNTLAQFKRATDPAIRDRSSYEYRVNRPDGSTCWVLAHGEAVFRDTPSGTIPVRYVGTVQDITARKRAEEELAKLATTLEQRVRDALAERQLWADVFERTDAMISAVAPDHTLMAVNKACADAFEELFGVRPKAGDTIDDLFGSNADAKAATLAAWDRALAGEQFTLTEEFTEPDRTRPYIELRFSPIFDADGKIIAASQYAVDITDRLRREAELARAQEALRQSQKLESMGQLTGGVAHDFNNLLTPIIGSLDLLQRKSVADERTARLIDGALQSAERAKTLVQRLLAFARRQPLQPVPVDLASLIEGMAELVDSTSGPRVAVETDIAPNLPPVEADPNQLEMALLNLSVNARDAMPDGGTLTIAASLERTNTGHRSKLAPGKYVRLTVSDSGTGMDEAVLSRAVEPFFSTKSVGHGTGLGLSMVHGLAAQLGGSLTLRSKVGLGTTAELWLPVSSGSPTSQAAPDAKSGSIGAGTVLLVDDEELVRRTAAEMLTDLGYNVVEANSAEEALRLLKSGLHVEVVVTDHMMPGMTGADLAREIGTMMPAMPVLIVSGYAENGLDADLPRLTKPFRRSELSASLSKLVR